MTENQKIYRKLIIIFIFSTFLFSISIFFIYQLEMNRNTRMTLLLVLLIGFLVFLIWFKPRHFYHNMQLKFDRLRQEAEQPRMSKFDPFSNEWTTKLKSENFHAFMDQEDFVLFHRLRKEPQDQVLRQPMLEIIIIIRNKKIPFNHSVITNAVNQLEKDYRIKKKHVMNYTILPIKYGDQFDSNLKDQIDEVTFEKNGNHHITVINSYYLSHKQMIYFLYNKHYTPSLYYKHAADTLYHLLKNKSE